MNSGNIYSEMSANSASSKKNSSKSGFQGANTDTYAKMAKSVVIGTIVSLFSAVLLFIVFAFIINLMFGDPDKVINIFTAIIASTGALIGGFRASGINGSNGFIVGLMTGIAASIVIFAVMLFSGKHNGENINVMLRIILIVCQIVFASIGGVLAVNSNGKKTGGRSRSYSSAFSASKNRKK